MSRQGDPVLKAAGTMGAAVLISRILGLVREQVLAILFGAGNATDAFNVAFRIPGLLRNLFAEGAMSASFVPIFTQTRTEEGDRRAWRLAGLVFRVLFVTVASVAVAGMLLSPWIVGAFASSFKITPGKFELTLRMTRVMFPFFPLVALAAAFMGVLNACGVFFLPAFASALFNLTSIIVGVVCSRVILLYGPRLGLYGIQPIEGMAIGVVAGGLVQAFCQYPALRRQGYRWPKKTPSDPAWRQDPRLKQMVWMLVPGTLGLAATQINILINTVLATTQGPGSVSWLSYAFRLMQFPIGIFGVSLATAMLPVVSRQWVDRDLEAASATLSRTLRQIFAINLPASAGLAFLGGPIIALIFQYGRFYGEDTQKTAMALAMYAIGLTAYSGVKVLVPACYAFGNARIPVISSVISVGVTLVLNLLMVRSLGFWGLALGTSVAAILNGVFLLFAVRKLLEEKGGQFRLEPLARSFLQNLCVALAMGFLCMMTHRGLAAWLPDSVFIENLGKSALPISRGIRVSFVIVEGLLAVVVMARIFRLDDTSEAVDFFAERLKKKLWPAKT